MKRGWGKGTLMERRCSTHRTQAHPTHPSKERGRPPATLSNGRSSNSAGLSRRHRGNGPDLLEHAEGVPVRPFLDDPSALEAADGDSLDHDVLAGGRDAHDLTRMSSAPFPARRDRVALADLILDRDVRTLEGFAVLVDVFLRSLRPANGLRTSRVVTYVVRADELVDDAEVLPRVFEHLPNDLLAVRHSTSLTSSGRGNSTPASGSDQWPLRPPALRRGRAARPPSA